MAQRRLLVGRVFAVAWRTPELEDLPVIVGELKQAETRLGQRLIYLSLIGPHALPQGPVRDGLVGFYREVLGHCDSMHFVIEGSEFELSIKRSVIANVLLVVQARGRIFIENSLEHVYATSPIKVRGELSAAMKAANEQHFFDYARSPVDK